MKKSIISIKKILFILSCFIIFVTILVLFVFNGDKKIGSFIKNIEKLDNYSIKISIDNSDLIGELNNNNKYIVKIDKINNTYYLNYNNLKNSNITYIQNMEDKSNIYKYDNNVKKWIYFNSKIENINILEILKTGSKMKKIDSDIKGMKKYKVVIDSSKIKSNYLLKEYYNLYKKVIDLNNANAYIYIDSNNYIRQILLDFTNNEAKIIFKIDLYNFNKSSVVIPEDIINSVLNLEESTTIDDSLDKYTEEQIMLDIALSSAVYCKAGTIDFSKYKGELNDYLELKKYNLSIITQGIIKINNDCDILVEKDFIINGKTCTINEDKYESCK